VKIILLYDGLVYIFSIIQIANFDIFYDKLQFLSLNWSYDDWFRQKSL